MPTGRVVAELGRPETPEEEAARKAESSRVYRSSQSFRNLIAALLATLAVVVVVVLAVPRGEAPQTQSIDPAPLASAAAEAYGREIVVPVVPADWRVNAAGVEGDTAGTTEWTIVYAPPQDGFLRVAQAFDVDDAWARSTLLGTTPEGVVTIDGVSWDVFEPDDPSSAANISFALGTQAGADYVLVYGSAAPETVRDIAATLTAQIDILRSADS
ncbi:DUF4245 domain-containing protein [Microbacterium sp. LRZ72]|uniref:DUF4245 family protein n=1 Tax=Microbacterium sp. LRZ72 TaxID=2942481 RepID=UPI0029B0FAC5|nr:DUF4245 family protein [Microbacterium sp. LRZ72]MDX2375801.1 DUF4245 domain-containing protein [Microbacterium sp. LRZ72]